MLKPRSLGLGSPDTRGSCPQRFFQVVSFMVDAENKEKWDDAQQVRGWASRPFPPGPTPASDPNLLSVSRYPLALCTCCVSWRTSFTWWAMPSRPSRAL